MDIWERIRFARDRALEAEETERQRLAEADTSDLQQAASVRLATRQAVREALDDVLDEQSEPAKGKATSKGDQNADAGGESTQGEAETRVVGGGDAGGEGSPAAESGLSSTVDDVEDDPGAQATG